MKYITIVLVLGLAGCGHKPLPAPEIVTVQRNCIVEATAAIPPEPKAPQGALMDTPSAIWLGTGILPRMREFERRLTKIQENCKGN